MLCIYVPYVTYMYMYSTCHLQTEILLILPFLFGCFLFLFLAWLLWLGLQILLWIVLVRVDTPVLFLILEKKFSAFHCWSIVLALDMSYSIMLKYAPFHTKFVGSFHHERIMNFIKCFFCICWDDHDFFFILLMWCSLFIDLYMLKHSCIPVINPIWS